jgi:hypothetical protein
MLRRDIVPSHAAQRLVERRRQAQLATRPLELVLALRNWIDKNDL